LAINYHAVVFASTFSDYAFGIRVNQEDAAIEPVPWRIRTVNTQGVLGAKDKVRVSGLPDTRIAWLK
jgi:hypothetical protein